MRPLPFFVLKAHLFPAKLLYCFNSETVCQTDCGEKQAEVDMEMFK